MVGMTKSPSPKCITALFGVDVADVVAPVLVESGEGTGVAGS
jgi:hypothetical protein